MLQGRPPARAARVSGPGAGSGGRSGFGDVGRAFRGGRRVECRGPLHGLAADEASEALALIGRSSSIAIRSIRARPIRRRAADSRAIGRCPVKRRSERGGSQCLPEGGGPRRSNRANRAPRRAAYQFLVSGHIDEGLSAYGAILDPMGLSLPRTPRRALFRLLLSRPARPPRPQVQANGRKPSSPREKLELVDIFRSLALGISIVDVIRGADYQTRSLLLALEAGEPLRSRWPGMGGVHVACQGRPAWRRTERLVSAASEPRRTHRASACPRHGQPLGGRRVSDRPLPVGDRVFTRAEAIFRDRCTGVIWELDHHPDLHPLVAVLPGSPGRAAAALPGNLPGGGERGDRYMVATPGPFVGTFARLGDDDVEGAGGSPERHWGNGRIRVFTYSISIFTTATSISTCTPVMWPAPGGASRKPNRCWNRRSCCGFSRLRPT